MRAAASHPCLLASISSFSFSRISHRERLFSQNVQNDLDVCLTQEFFKRPKQGSRKAKNSTATNSEMTLVSINLPQKVKVFSPFSVAQTGLVLSCCDAHIWWEVTFTTCPVGDIITLTVSCMVLRYLQPRKATFSISKLGGGGAGAAPGARAYEIHWVSGLSCYERT